MIKYPKKNKGFILFEILVSLTILSAGILFLIKSLSLITKNNQQIRNHSLAVLALNNYRNRNLSGEAPLTKKDFSMMGKSFLCEPTVSQLQDKLKKVTLLMRWPEGNKKGTAVFSYSLIDAAKH